MCGQCSVPLVSLEAETWRARAAEGERDALKVKNAEMQGRINTLVAQCEAFYRKLGNARKEAKVQNDELRAKVGELGMLRRRLSFYEPPGGKPDETAGEKGRKEAPECEGCEAGACDARYGPPMHFLDGDSPHCYVFAKPAQDSGDAGDKLDGADARPVQCRDCSVVCYYRKSEDSGWEKQADGCPYGNPGTPGRPAGDGGALATESPEDAYQRGVEDGHTEGVTDAAENMRVIGMEPGESPKDKWSALEDAYERGFRVGRAVGTKPYTCLGCGSDNPNHHDVDCKRVDGPRPLEKARKAIVGIGRFEHPRDFAIGHILDHLNSVVGDNRIARDLARHNANRIDAIEAAIQVPNTNGSDELQLLARATDRKIHDLKRAGLNLPPCDYDDQDRPLDGTCPEALEGADKGESE